MVKCKHCGLSNFKKNGTYKIRGNRVQRYKCKECKKDFAGEYFMSCLININGDFLSDKIRIKSTYRHIANYLKVRKESLYTSIKKRNKLNIKHMIYIFKELELDNNQIDIVLKPNKKKKEIQSSFKKPIKAY